MRLKAWPGADRPRYGRTAAHNPRTRREIKTMTTAEVATRILEAYKSGIPIAPVRTVV